MKWISVKDRLPEMWQKILVYIPNFSGILYGSKDLVTVSIYAHVDSLLGATHWMPLPEPPNEVD